MSSISGGRMDIVRTELDLRHAVEQIRQARQTLAFVPTMGFLHEGHLSLVRLAHKHATKVCVSIFVNPTQFNDPKDFEKYPIDLDKDLALLRDAGTDLVFVPTKNMIYGDQPLDRPGGFQTWVSLSQLPLPHEGEFRPGHFMGVSTVVAILFNLVRPDCAVFGEKDFQQLRIIEQMVEDLHFGLHIVRGELIRESNGLAMSSRNVRLSPEGLRAALSLSRGLLKALQAFRRGERLCAVLSELVEEELRSSPLIRTEYVRLVEERTLAPLVQVDQRARLLVAAYVENVRLIDNVALDASDDECF